MKGNHAGLQRGRMKAGAKNFPPPGGWDNKYSRRAKCGANGSKMPSAKRGGAVPSSSG